MASVPKPTQRSTAFGLDVCADVPLAFLERSRAKPTGRELVLRGGYPDAASAGWPGEGELLCDELEPGGAINFRIESNTQAGYLIWGPAYGASLLARDGRSVTCAPGALPDSAWQRLLVAQVLPFAALLAGLEVLHASAVVLDGRTIACLGPSRAGKTSVALELCRAGASFLADDVLAVERRDGQLFGHPGSPVAGLDHAEAARIERTRLAKAQAGPRRPGRSPLDAHDRQPLAVNQRERLLHVPTAAEPAPLTALLFLDRRPDGPPQPRFEALADARALLASTFNFVLSEPARLRGLLEVCALAAATARVERVLAGPTVDASLLAQAIATRVGPWA